MPCDAVGAAFMTTSSCVSLFARKQNGKKKTLHRRRIPSISRPGMSGVRDWKAVDGAQRTLPRQAVDGPGSKAQLIMGGKILGHVKRCVIRIQAVIEIKI